MGRGLRCKHWSQPAWVRIPAGPLAPGLGVSHPPLRSLGSPRAQRRRRHPRNRAGAVQPSAESKCYLDRPPESGAAVRPHKGAGGDRESRSRGNATARAPPSSRRQHRARHRGTRVGPDASCANRGAGNGPSRALTARRAGAGGGPASAQRPRRSPTRAPGRGRPLGAGRAPPAGASGRAPRLAAQRGASGPGPPSTPAGPQGSGRSRQRARRGEARSAEAPARPGKGAAAAAAAERVGSGLQPRPGGPPGESRGRERGPRSSPAARPARSAGPRLPAPAQPASDLGALRAGRGPQPSSHRWSPGGRVPRAAALRAPRDPRARPRPPPGAPPRSPPGFRRRSCPATRGPAAAPRPPPTFLPSFPGAAGRRGGRRGSGRARGAGAGPGPGLAGGRWARGPGSPPPPRPRPASRPPDARRTPPTRGPGGPGPLTWTALPPAPAEPRRPPRPRPAGLRPADTEAEVRPASGQTDSPRSPLAAPGARASAAAHPISGRRGGRAGRRDYANRLAGVATPLCPSRVPPMRRSDATESQSQPGEAGLCRY